MLTVIGNDVFLNSSTCDWTLQYKTDNKEGVIFTNYGGVEANYEGACYGGYSKTFTINSVLE